jgi:hypothetical protein
MPISLPKSVRNSRHRSENTPASEMIGKSIELHSERVTICPRF